MKAFMFLIAMGLLGSTAARADGPPPPRGEVIAPTCKSSIQDLILSAKLYQKMVDFEAAPACADNENCVRTKEQQQNIEARQVGLDKLKSELDQATALTENLCK
jgi:hypothetical protein